MQLSRRNFVRMAAASGALAAPWRAQAATPGRARVGVLLYGGNDGWNMVIPTGDRHAAWLAARGSVGIRATALTPLAGSELALHPAMGALHPLWEQGALQLVLNAGAAPAVSHWQAQRMWQAAMPDAVAARSAPLAEQLREVARAIAGGARGEFLVSQGGYDTHEAQVDDDTTLGTHAALLGELAGALAGFWQALEAAGAADGVSLATMSDFGRAVRGNDARGTDHGGASNHLVLRRGSGRSIIGAYPDLSAELRPALPHRHYLDMALGRTPSHAIGA